MPDVKELWARLVRLERERQPFEKRWQDVVDYVHRSHPDFTRKRIKGRENSIPCWDSTANRSSNILASAFNNALTNKAVGWYRHGISDIKEAELLKERPVKEWLEATGKITQDEFNSSNFYQVMQQVWQMGQDFGTSCLFFEDKDEAGEFLFRSIPLPELFLENNREGIADRIYRKFKMPVRDIVEMWPAAKSNKQVAEALAGNQDHKELDVLHYCGPKKGYKTINREHEYVSIYCLKEGDCINLKAGKYAGFHEQPYLVFRWEIVSGVPYGTGIAMDLMPDIKTLNATIELKFQFLPLAINPPIATTPNNIQAIGDDGNMKPGCIVVVQKIDNIKRLEVGGHPTLHEMEEEKQRQKIKDHYYENQLLLAPDRPEQTAYEIQQRANIVYSLLTRPAENANTHVLTPMARRAIGILMRAKKFPDMPESLQGRKLVFGFVSPLERAQMMQAVQAIRVFLETLVSLASVNPTLLGLVEWYKLATQLAEGLGVPLELLLEEKAWKEMQKQQSESAQTAEELQNLETAAGVMQRAGRGAQSLGMV